MVGHPKHVKKALEQGEEVAVSHQLASELTPRTCGLQASISFVPKVAKVAATPVTPHSLSSHRQLSTSARDTEALLQAKISSSWLQVALPMVVVSLPPSPMEPQASGSVLASLRASKPEHPRSTKSCC